MKQHDSLLIWYVCLFMYLLIKLLEVESDLLLHIQPDAATIAASLKDPKTDHKTPSERALEEIEKKLTTLQVGLEVLMGICSKVPEDKDEDDGEIVQALFVLARLLTTLLQLPLQMLRKLRLLKRRRMR